MRKALLITPAGVCARAWLCVLDCLKTKTREEGGQSANRYGACFPIFQRLFEQSVLKEVRNENTDDVFVGLFFAFSARWRVLLSIN